MHAAQCAKNGGKRCSSMVDGGGRKHREYVLKSRYLSVLIDSVKSAWANTNSLESGNHFNFSRGKSNK